MRRRMLKKELLDTYYNFVTCYHGFSTPVYKNLSCVFVSLNLSQASKGEREENVPRSNDPFAYYNGRKNEGAINKIICILYEAKYNKFKRCICFCVCVVKKLKTF